MSSVLYFVYEYHCPFCLDNVSRYTHLRYYFESDEGYLQTSACLGRA